jgi:hypothetical protein
MRFPTLHIPSLYQRDRRSLEVGAAAFAPLRPSSRFICISSVLSRWSNKGEMHI